MKVAGDACGERRFSVDCVLVVHVIFAILSRLADLTILSCAVFVTAVDYLEEVCPCGFFFLVYRTPLKSSSPVDEQMSVGTMTLVV